MPDFDQSIFDDKNLGSANHLSFLDEIEAQKAEDFHAAREGREPRKVKPRERYGEFANTAVNGPIEFYPIGEEPVEEVSEFDPETSPESDAFTVPDESPVDPTSAEDFAAKMAELKSQVSNGE